ncbi:MAG: glucose-1-phosphate adenylyltransferase [FCB group bacterium]|nr:glucose-1-phosphate adenylyltransferase [FCB group bacterium]
MRNVTTMIMAGGKGKRLLPLTRSLAKSAIRFGGIYRIIDFTLSNCLNSGIRRVYVITQYASASLERHIRTGWSYLFREQFGEYIETRPPQQIDDTDWYKGTAHCIYKNLSVIKQEKPQAVLILSGDHIYKMDYHKLLTFHHDTNADMTLACVDLPVAHARHMGVLGIDKEYNIKSFDEKPESPLTIPQNPNKSLCNLGIYCFKLEVLVDFLKRDVADEKSEHDFGKNIIPKMLAEGAKLKSYLFYDENRKDSKYWRDIGTIDAYYEANMDLVEIDPFFNLYDQEWPVHSFIPQLPPAKTVFNWQHENRVGMAIDSLLSPGAIISGGYVERSILSPEVKVRSYAEIYNSILFDGVEIGRNAVINNAIIDHGVNIAPGTRIGGGSGFDNARHHVSAKGITVVTDSD